MSDRVVHVGLTTPRPILSVSKSGIQFIIKNVSYSKFSVMKPTVTRNFLSTAPTFLIDHGHTMEKHNKTQLIRHIF